MKYFLCFLLIAFASQGSAQLLECYLCENCENVNAQTPRVNCSHPGPPTTTVPTTTEATTKVSGFETLPTLSPSTTPPPIVNPTIPGTPPSNPTGPVLTPPTTTPIPETTPGLVRRRREAEPFASHFSCFRVRFNNGTAGHTQVDRGCVQNGGNTDQTCLRANSYRNVTECRICSGNRCNSSGALYSSVILILAAVLVAFKMF